MGETEFRKLRQLWGAVERLAEGKSDLASAVPALDLAVRELEDADPEWVERFRRRWEVLERVHVAVSERAHRRGGTAYPTAEETREVEAATADLRALVAEVLPADERDE